MSVKFKSERKCRIAISFVAVIFWMGVILSFSGDIAAVSESKSGFVTEKIGPIIASIYSNFTDATLETDDIHGIVRKMAHMFNYFILAILTLNALRYVALPSKTKYYVTFAVTIGFAMMDEFYQTFIPGRSGQIRDVIIDNLGSLMGIILVILIIGIKNKIRKNWL